MSAAQAASWRLRKDNNSHFAEAAQSCALMSILESPRGVRAVLEIQPRSSK